MEKITQTFVNHMKIIIDGLESDISIKEKMRYLRAVGYKTDLMRQMNPEPKNILMDFVMVIGIRILINEIKTYDDVDAKLRLVKKTKELLDNLTNAVKSNGDLHPVLEQFVTLVYSTTPGGVIAKDAGLIEI